MKAKALLRSTLVLGLLCVFWSGCGLIHHKPEYSHVTRKEADKFALEFLRAFKQRDKQFFKEHSDHSRLSWRALQKSATVEEMNDFSKDLQQYFTFQDQFIGDAYNSYNYLHFLGVAERSGCHVLRIRTENYSGSFNYFDVLLSKRNDHRDLRVVIVDLYMFWAGCWYSDVLYETPLMSDGYRRNYSQEEVDFIERVDSTIVLYNEDDRMEKADSAWNALPQIWRRVPRLEACRLRSLSYLDSVAYLTATDRFAQLYPEVRETPAVAEFERAESRGTPDEKLAAANNLAEVLGQADANVNLMRSIAHQEAGDLEEAQRFAKEAVRLESNCNRCREQLFLTYLALGLYERAAHELEVLDQADYYVSSVMEYYGYEDFFNSDAFCELETRTPDRWDYLSFYRAYPDRDHWPEYDWEDPEPDSLLAADSAALPE